MKRYILQITSCVLLLGLLSSMISPLTYATQSLSTKIQQPQNTLNQPKMVASNSYVTIPDAALKACINTALKQDATAEITPEQALSFTSLGCVRKHISSLQGLEAFKNLKYLSLYNNDIQDISALAFLMQLETLDISYNKVQDLQPISNCLKLTSLTLHVNSIKNLEPLQKLIKLRSLYILGNQTSDLSPLAQLINLTTLSINISPNTSIEPLRNLKNLNSLILIGRGLQTIEPLTGLTNLTYLTLGETALEDIKPIASLKKLKTLSFNNTNIKDITSLTHLTELTELNILNSKVSDISSLNTKNLRSLNLSENQITDFSSIKTVPATFGRIRQVVNLDHIPQKTELTLRDTGTGEPFTLKNIVGTSTIDAKGILRFTSLGNHTIEYYKGTEYIGTIRAITVEPTLTFPSKSLQLFEAKTFTLTPTTIPVETPVTYTSNNPAVATVDATGKVTAVSEGSAIITAHLEIQGDNITETIPVKVLRDYYRGSIFLASSSLEKCIKNNRMRAFERRNDPLSSYDVEHTTSIYCSNAGITSLQGLEQFQYLETLILPRNSIRDISPLASLSSLKEVDLSGQNIENISALSNKNLTSLNLSGNKITDFSGINTLPKIFSKDAQNINLDDVSQETTFVLKDAGSGLPFIINNKIGTSTIDANGTLRFTSVGEHVIEYYNRNEFIGTLHVKTFLPSLTLSENNVSISTNQVKQVIATTTSTVPVMYTSSNPAIATVNQDGKITGKSNGTTTILAKISINTLSIRQKIKVTVSDNIDLPDTALKACINTSLGQEPTASLTTAQALTITSLDCENKGISSLRGLEMFTNIKTLKLSRNTIEDITPLKELASLQNLQISSNKIKTIEALQGKQFNQLYIGSNQITDFSPLTLTPFSYSLWGHNIMLGTVPQDTQLTLRETYSGKAYTIHNIVGSSTISMDGTLRFTTLGEHKIEFYTGTTLVGVITATTVQPSISFPKDTLMLTSDGTKTLTPTITPAQSPVTYSVKNPRIASVSSDGIVTGLKPGSTTITAQITVGTKIFEKTLTVSVSTPVQLRNSELRACVNEHLGQEATDPIGMEQALNITTLTCSNKGLRSLRGIDVFKNIRNLKIDHNQITSIEELRNLERVSVLDISNNPIEDISPIGHKNFSILHMDNTEVSDIRPLTGHLYEGFSVANNHITDFSNVVLSSYNMRYHGYYFIGGKQTVDLGTVSQQTTKVISGPYRNPGIINNIIGEATIDDNGVLRFTSTGKHVIEFNLGSEQTVILTATTVDKPVFKDAKLKACVNEKLGQSPTSSITKEQALSITSLDCANRSISSLNGIEMFANLKSLNISDNPISSLDQLRFLQMLESLNIINTKVSYSVFTSNYSLPDSKTVTSLSFNGQSTYVFGRLEKVSITIHNTGNSDFSLLHFIYSSTGNLFTIKNIEGNAYIDNNAKLVLDSPGKHVIEVYKDTKYITTLTISQGT